MLSEEKEYNDLEDLDKMFTYDEAMTVAQHRITKEKFAIEVIARVKYEVREQMRETLDNFRNMATRKNYKKHPHLQLVVEYFEDDRNLENYKFIVLKEMV